MNLSLLLLQTSLPGETKFWLIAPIIVMFLAALIHTIKNWNKAR